MRRKGDFFGLRAKWLRGLLATTVLLGGATSAVAIASSLDLVDDLHEPQAEQVSQADLLDLVESGDDHAAFEGAFEMGDELFEVRFNALDGVGANVGENQRFTRVPRADLDGDGEWANHFPRRETGPNAQACNECHNRPFDDGAGSAATPAHRDPTHSASLDQFIRRDVPHLFGLGALQRLAEEMTEALHATRDAAAKRACRSGRKQTTRLRAKGVSFGAITAIPGGHDDDDDEDDDKRACRVEFDTKRVRGVSDDLVVRPYQWKGSVATVRDFNRGASHNELGMQAVELTGYGVDGDFDGVVDEMTIGDQTALVIYLAAQPRPTTKVELASLGLIEPLSDEEQRAIRRGRRLFGEADCSSCHRPALRLLDPVFSEPSQNANFRDEVFPSGLDPVAEGVNPKHPVSFDLTSDQPDNVIEDANGDPVHLGSFRKDGQDRAVIRLFGDLRHHDMGSELAESIDETGVGASVWLTKELWGVGSTPPYLHDGRATTLTEAILAHGGEAARSRQAFERMSRDEQTALIAFLDNLVLFKMAEEE